VGAFSDRYGIGVALAFTAVFFVAGAGVMARMESGSLANKSTLRAS